MNVYGITDCGLVRTMNQDCYASCELDHGILAVVCDGMGGAKSGNVASQMAVDRFVNAIQESTMEEPAAVLNQALDEANDAVRRRSLEDANCAGMGTTLVAAYLQSDLHGYVLNVGDSRGYQIGASGIRQITRDHSLVAELVARGKITPEEARTHPNKNIITRAVGVRNRVSIDFFDMKLEKEDIILMCSDGLSNMIEDEEIEKIIREGREDLPEIALELVERANRNGGKDNIAVVLIEPLACEVEEC